MVTTSAHTDKDLLKQISTGDADAFTQIFNKYWDAVYSTALYLLKSPELAEDIAQDIFLNIWKNKAKTGEIEHPEAFFNTATRNMVFDRMRRLKREDDYLAFLYQTIQSGHYKNNNQTRFNELPTVVEAGIKKLPPQQQRAFRLSRERGMTHEQIAREMGISKDTVKDYIVRAIAYLRKYLREYAAILLLFIEQMTRR